MGEEMQARRARLAVLMAWAAGGVDAIGYLALAHLFTAHMSGNSAAMGAHLGRAEWAEALRRSLPILPFLAGILVGAAATEAVCRAGFRSPFSIALLAEAGLLLAFLASGSTLRKMNAPQPRSIGEYALFVALPSLAMGLQNATLRRVGGKTVRTTYVTGTLTDMCEELVAWGFWRRDARAGVPQKGPPPSLARIGLLAGIWVAFIVGGVAGGFAFKQWYLNALALPLAALACVIAADLIRPIGLPDA